MFKKLIGTKFLSVVFIAGLALMAFSIQLQHGSSITSLQKDFKEQKDIVTSPAPPSPNDRTVMMERDTRPPVPPPPPRAAPKAKAAPKAEPKGITIPDLPNSCFLLGKWFSFIGGVSLIGKMGFGFFSFIRRKLKRKKDAPIEMPVND